MGHEATVFYKRLAGLPSEKLKESYATEFWDRLDVVYLFVVFVQQSIVLKEQGPHRVTV